MKETAEKAQVSQHSVSSSIDKINAAESERNKAEELLRQHQKDFQIQYEENQKAMEQVGDLVSAAVTGRSVDCLRSRRSKGCCPR